MCTFTFGHWQGIRCAMDLFGSNVSQNQIKISSGRSRLGSMADIFNQSAFHFGVVDDDDDNDDDEIPI